MDYQHWLKAAAARLTHSDSARRDAEILLGFVTGEARTFLMAGNSADASAATAAGDAAGAPRTR